MPCSPEGGAPLRPGQPSPATYMAAHRASFPTGQPHVVPAWQWLPGLEVLVLDLDFTFNLLKIKRRKIGVDSCSRHPNLLAATALGLNLSAQRFSRAFSESSMVKTWPVHRSKHYSSDFCSDFLLLVTKELGDCFKGNPWALICGLQTARTVAEQAASYTV